ncbi:hypothetical protein Tco_0612753 [Tanacetum coccineum]
MNSFIPTQYQLDDIFTKPLDDPTFKRLIVELGSLEDIPSSNKAKIKNLYTSESKIQEKLKSQAEKCKCAPYLPFVCRTYPQSQKN